MRVKLIVKYVNTQIMDSEAFGKRNEGDYEQDMKISLSKRGDKHVATRSP